LGSAITMLNNCLELCATPEQSIYCDLSHTLIKPYVIVFMYTVLSGRFFIAFFVRPFSKLQQYISHMSINTFKTFEIICKWSKVVWWYSQLLLLYVDSILVLGARILGRGAGERNSSSFLFYFFYVPQLYFFAGARWRRIYPN
jgi:hypothetical protein